MIFNNKSAGNFTTLPNKMITDNKLSFKAKGVLAYLLSRPSDWDVTVQDISKQATEGLRAVYAALDELVEAGYVVRRQTRSNGRITQHLYDVYNSPHLHNVQVDNVQVQNSTQLNTDITNTEYTKYTSTKVDESEKETFHSLVRKLGFTDKVIPTPKRLSQMKKRLKTYTVEELLAAADAIASNPWLQGENPQGKRYGTIDYLLRNDEQINNLLLDSKAVQPKSYFEQALERQNGAS